MKTLSGDKPLISVIVPVYNAENYIDECIQSIVRQVYENLEIIIIDDGSSDGSFKKCIVWAEKDERVKLIHQKNQGLSIARNKGISISKGDFISFIDSDDWIENDFYQILLEKMISYNADIAASGVIKFYKNIEVRYPASKQVVFTAEKALETLIEGTGFTVMACNKVYRRRIIERNLFPENRYHEDDFVMYKIISSSKNPVFCYNAVYHYRQRIHGIIGSGLINRFDDKYDSYFQNLSIIKEKYPDLLFKMKLLLLQYSVDDCTELLTYNDKKSIDLCERVLNYRKSIKFSLKEIRRMNRYQLRNALIPIVFFKFYCMYRTLSVNAWREKYELFE